MRLYFPFLLPLQSRAVPNYVFMSLICINHKNKRKRIENEEEEEDRLAQLEDSWCSACVVTHTYSCELPPSGSAWCSCCPRQRQRLPRPQRLAASASSSSPGTWHRYFRSMNAGFYGIPEYSISQGKRSDESERKHNVKLTITFYFPEMCCKINASGLFFVSLCLHCALQYFQACNASSVSVCCSLFAFFLSFPP